MLGSPCLLLKPSLSRDSKSHAGQESQQQHQNLQERSQAQAKWR